jgi:acyl-CoA thioester hydrolase
MIRDLGHTYKKLEETGVFMPVASVHAKYLKPIYYDELITIETSLKKMPQARMVFYHTILNEKMEVVHTAEVTLVFLDAATNRPVRVPEYMLEALEKMTDLEQN